MNDLIYKTWVLWELSTPRRDLITDELANCSRRRFFQTPVTASTIGHVCQARSEVQAEKGWCVQCKSPGERELGIVQEAWTCERTSSAVQPRRSLRGSEAEPTTSSWYSSFRSRTRSLDPERLQRAARHSRTNGASPLGLHRCFAPRLKSTLGSDLRRGKILLAFRLYTASSNNPDPHCIYIKCRSVYGPLAFGLPRVIWWGIVEAPADVPKAENVQPIGKGSKGKCARRTALPSPLRTTPLRSQIQI